MLGKAHNNHELHPVSHSQVILSPSAYQPSALPPGQACSRFCDCAEQSLLKEIIDGTYYTLGPIYIYIYIGLVFAEPVIRRLTLTVTTLTPQAGTKVIVHSLRRTLHQRPYSIRSLTTLSYVVIVS